MTAKRSKYRKVYAEAAERVLGNSKCYFSCFAIHSVACDNEMNPYEAEKLYSNIFNFSTGDVFRGRDERALALAFAITIPDGEKWD